VTLVRFDPASAVPPFEQLRSQLVSAIRAGELAPGVSLPTVRQLAADLGLAKNTVAKAYQALEAEGLVRGEGRNGTVVLGGTTAVDPGAATRLADAARRYLAEVRRLGASPDDAVAAVHRAALEH
jgi:DNA-binding transcriptional regulator YhcF (GntR family)